MKQHLHWLNSQKTTLKLMATPKKWLCGLVMLVAFTSLNVKGQINTEILSGSYFTEWTTPSGGGKCGWSTINNTYAACDITVCVGDPICFTFGHTGNATTPTFTLNFSDGQSLDRPPAH